MVDRNRWSVYILALVRSYHKLGPCSVVRFWINPLYSTNCVFPGSTRGELIKKKKTISTYVLQLKRRFTIREYFFKKLNEYCRIDFTWTLHMIYNTHVVVNDECCGHKCLIQKWCLCWNICWINTIKESKNKRLDSWGLGEIF